MPNTIRNHKGMSHVDSFHIVFLKFKIAVQECLSSAEGQFIQKGHTHDQ